MPVVSKEILKSYFQNGKHPNEAKYVDLIDTMGLGDMLKEDYDGNDDGQVDSADYAAVAPWSGISGKPSTYPPSSHTHVGGDITSQVSDSDKLDGLHASSFHRTDQNIENSNDIILGGNISADEEIVTKSFLKEESGVYHGSSQVGRLIMYSAGSVLTNASWTLSTSHAVGAYTMTRAMFGWPSDAIALYVALQAQVAVSGTGSVGLNDNSSVYVWSVYDKFSLTTAGIQGNVLLDGSGNFYLRIGFATSNILVQICGYYV